MRAVQYSVTGDPDVLTAVDRPMPEPGNGEVRVRIHRSGVNPTDWKSRRGGAPGVGSTRRRSRTRTGQVSSTRSEQDVDASWQDRRVWIWEAAHQRPTGGTAQEYAVLPVSHVVGLPDDRVVRPGRGARRAVPDGPPLPDRQRGRAAAPRAWPAAGRVVLVAGGAGAVGNAAIQLAHWSGATVVTTVSSDEKAELARRAGADHIVDYKQQDVVEAVKEVAPEGVNTIVEVSPAVNASIDAEVLALHGTVAVYANNGGNDVSLPIRPSMVPNVRWQFVLVYNAPDDWRARAIADVTTALKDGAIAVGEDIGLPLHHYPLERAADAHAAVEAGVIGKVAHRRHPRLIRAANWRSMAVTRALQAPYRTSLCGGWFNDVNRRRRRDRCRRRALCGGRAPSGSSGTARRPRRRRPGSTRPRPPRGGCPTPRRVRSPRGTTPARP